MTRQAIEKLLSYHWPGNVRELENTLKRGAALCHGNQIEAEDIVFIAGARPSAVEGADNNVSTLTIKGGLLDNEQRTLILKTLTRNRWNFTRTAEELGIGRTTLWRKVKKYNLARAVEEAGVTMQEEPVEI
jgi:transcriptional regulator of acetoin/glycerol metabolism